MSPSTTEFSAVDSGLNSVIADSTPVLKGDAKARVDSIRTESRESYVRPTVEALSELGDQIESANQRLSAGGISMSLGIDQSSGRIVVTLKDQKTQNIVLQIPSDTALNLDRRIEQLTGLILDRRG